MELSQEQTARLTMDFIYRLMMHHAMWYFQVKQQLGAENAREVMKNVVERSSDIQMKKLAKVLGFDIKQNSPDPLLSLPREKLEKLKETIAVNWLANDGVWFQAVEFSRNMGLAKKCNDACWSHFSPFEAWSIMQFLNLPENSGLEGLKTALQYRLYAAINKQSISDETKESFVFRMNDCRVQSARKRKGLKDYPCKSAGIVEYSTFAETIDKRIKTRCIGCPPDPHPEEWYCTWQFFLKK
jgi:hypothetical protein